MDISIVLPAYNEERAIKDVLLKLNNVFSEIKNKEIIVVDDASKDDTFLICDELAKVIPRLCIQTTFYCKKIELHLFIMLPLKIH